MFSCVFWFLYLENLAFKKPTQMIGSNLLRPSSRAVDGNTQTTIDPSCIHSTDGVYFANPWWRVDLEQVEPVNEVYIVNRGDCCGDRLNPFEIRVGKTKFNEPLPRIIVSHKPRETNTTKFSKYRTFYKHCITFDNKPTNVLSYDTSQSLHLIITK